ncbi:MAG: hypothetical protein FWE33_02975 [Defluviitaleaceae bacterium]|nr:hypothetical protein [Defluviitaleaceae bacterium]
MKKIRIEMRLGFLFIALMGIFNVLIPIEFLAGLFCALGIIGIIVGSLPKSNPIRLQVFNNKHN